MKKRMIFHVPLKLRDGYVSGSTIRPQKMMAAFRSIGYEVDAVWGTSSERKIKIEEIKRKIAAGAKYDFLYAENNTVPRLIATDKHHIPRHPFVDRHFFAYIKKHKIPMGIFYRDMYWKYPQAMEDLSWWKRNLIIALQKRELAEYEQLFDVLFLPSMRCLKPLETKFSGTVCALLPGMPRAQLEAKVRHEKLHIFYVGGIGNQYDLRLFLSVVKEMPKIDFTLCCRKVNWEPVKSVYEPYLADNIHIIHKQGEEELLPYFRQADVACMFFKPDIYREMAMPVKLFEYMANLLPIISNEGNAAGDFVREHDIGWPLPYEEKAVRDCLQKLVTDYEEIAFKRGNIEKVLPDNTWEARASMAARILQGKGRKRTVQGT